MSLVTGAPRTATCAAATDVICYVVGHDAFQRVLEARPKIAEDISTLLGSRQLTLDEKGEKLSAEARARREAETSSRLLLRIRDFFHLG